MNSQLEAVTEACSFVSRQVRETYRTLHIHFIVHHGGQRREALAVAAQDILNHPAGGNRPQPHAEDQASEDSAILGTAVARQHLFFGLVSHYAMLSLCTINLEQFNSVQEARRYAWHLAWHAIDACQYHARPNRGCRGRTSSCAAGTPLKWPEPICAPTRSAP